MKYKKIITITLATILLCTTISAVVIAKDTNMDISSKASSVLRGRIFDLFTKLRGFFPILDKLLNNFKNTDPQVPQKPDTDVAPKLKFEISFNKVYKLEEPIIVEARLTNIGTYAVRLSEMNFKVGTLDYFIRTPDGLELQFVGEKDPRQMEIWTLFPGEENSRTIDIDIKCGLFNVIKSSGGVSGVPEPYEFIPGVYGIRAEYKSFYPIPTFTSETPAIWVGNLETEPDIFEIVEE